MDAITLLKTQHKEVEALFERYEKATTTVQKRQVVEQINDNLVAHTTIEEKIFYPTIFVGNLEDKLREAVEEHLGAKRIIADLVALNAADPQYDAKVKVLNEQIMHHVEEEEGPLFREVRAAFSKEQLEAMGEQMEAMFNALMKSHPSAEVPQQTQRAAPLPYAPRG